jgi:ElaB/YqjD/DUF883 family membrane-anchored ribosome-binding protein
MTDSRKPNNPIMRHDDGVSLRDYIDLRFNEAQRAIDKAEAMMSARLATMNEFRDQLKDQAGRFTTRDEVNIITGKMNEEIKALQKIADRGEGKASQNAFLFTAIMAVVGLILGIVNLFVK